MFHFLHSHQSKTSCPPQAARRHIDHIVYLLFSPAASLGSKTLWCCIGDFSENLSIRVMKHFSDILCHLSICPLSSVGGEWEAEIKNYTMLWFVVWFLLWLFDVALFGRLILLFCFLLVVVVVVVVLVGCFAFCLALFCHLFSLFGCFCCFVVGFVWLFFVFMISGKNR